MLARHALAFWRVDEASSEQIEAVFVAIYGRKPDAGEDAVSLIYAAANTLKKREALRVLEILS